MNNSDYNKADTAVENAQDNLKNAANEVNSQLDNMAEKAKEYIREQRNNDQEATKEGWLDQVKNNIFDAWEDTKDAASEAWEKTKDFSEDAKAEIRKKTN